MSNEELIEEEAKDVVVGEQSIQDIWENNKSSIQIGGIVLLALAAGLFYYFSSYKPGKEVDAQNSAYAPTRYFGVDSTNKALNGDGVNDGLIAVANDYSGTKAGELASYKAGVMLLQEGKFQEALDMLEDASFDDEILAAKVITLQGDCLSELGEYDKAGSRYMKAANERDNMLTRPEALYKAGLAFEEAGEVKSALNAWKELKSDFPKAQQAKNAKSYIAKLEAKLASK